MSRWGKAVSITYIAGYWVYWLLAAVTTWPHLPFTAWWSYVVFQLFYAVWWPILLLLSVFGFRW
jgi:hypothetical protein